MIKIILQHSDGRREVRRIDEDVVLEAHALRISGKLFGYVGPVAGRVNFREIVTIIDLEPLAMPEFL